MAMDAGSIHCLGTGGIGGTTGCCGGYYGCCGNYYCPTHPSCCEGCGDVPA